MGTLIKRSGRANYLNTTPATTDVYALMGQGFSEVTDSMNGNVETTQYVSDDTPSNSLGSYDPDIAFSGDVFDGDTAIDFLRGLAENRSTGADAETDYISYDTADVAGGEVDCFKQPVIVVMDSQAGGGGGENLKFSGTLKANGDQVAGTFNIASKTFTPSVS